ncbi:Tripartite-type tricarboxylate transporter, receptor component TctC [Bradyrhizobium erythrophlei]|uniref:Tripartite-type tricarboxylate transporter, receptor component TctC n=2 Tax=Bradyrhizobium erythrophlei TaxID=1437360 RepID=A0A1M7UAA1_9BRAD|nr:Tripartite-type tricarboxylate transporter, receptor component TctC [Bradyrhizobium erythrophlei]
MAGWPVVARLPGALAQSSRPVTIIVPYAAGGPTDTLARILAQRISVGLGQNVLIENVPGASGSIGVGRVARASPDGTTLSIGNVGSHVFNGAIYSLPYDLLNDLKPVALVASNAQLLLGKPGIPATTLEELITWIKAQPRAILIGTGGPGSAAHLSGVYLEQHLKISATMVPFRGTGPALQALMAEQIDILFDQVSNALPQVRAKTIKAYAVTAKNPSSVAPDIPTTDAAGLPGFYVAVWHGLWVPKDTRASVIASLNSAVVDALADSTVRARLAELGQDIPAPDQQTPQALGSFQKAEMEKWWPIIKAANIKPE